MINPGELISQLITTQMKIWKLQNVVADVISNDEVAEAARESLRLNKIRTELKNEINQLFGVDYREHKMYGKEEK